MVSRDLFTDAFLTCPTEGCGAELQLGRLVERVEAVDGRQWGLCSRLSALSHGVRQADALGYTDMPGLGVIQCTLHCARCDSQCGVQTAALETVYAFDLTHGVSSVAVGAVRGSTEVWAAEPTDLASAEVARAVAHVQRAASTLVAQRAERPPGGSYFSQSVQFTYIAMYVFMHEYLPLRRPEGGDDLYAKLTYCRASGDMLSSCSNEDADRVVLHMEDVGARGVDYVLPMRMVIAGVAEVCAAIGDVGGRGTLMHHLQGERRDEFFKCADKWLAECDASLVSR